MVGSPVAIEAMHVVVNKVHPKARILVHYVNSGLKRLKALGAQDRIIDRHLKTFWAAEQTRGLAGGSDLTQTN